MREAIRALGVSRQTVLRRVRRGELETIHVTCGRQLRAAKAHEELILLGIDRYSLRQGPFTTITRIT